MTQSAAGKLNENFDPRPSTLSTQTPPAVGLNRVLDNCQPQATPTRRSGLASLLAGEAHAATNSSIRAEIEYPLEPP